MELYPIDGDDYSLLQDAIEKLALHDAALRFHGTHSAALGNGLHVGFLGMLHSEIVKERLEREFNLELIVTAPSVTYHVTTKDGEDIEVTSPQHLPDETEIEEIREPMTRAHILVPRDYMGAVLQICQGKRGEMLTMQDVGTRLKLTYDLPLAEIVTAFHDELKSATSGFGSLEYKIRGYEPVEAVKLRILVNKEEIEALSVITVRKKAEQVGRRLTKKLKDVIPKQLFEIPIQAAIGGKVIARETVKAYRKDVTAKLYGGDRTRRMKLLKKQAEGKKRMKSVGSVELNQESFLAVLERD
jgi:GTP-binding protein LepA